MSTEKTTYRIAGWYCLPINTEIKSRLDHTNEQEAKELHQLAMIELEKYLTSDEIDPIPNSDYNLTDNIEIDNIERQNPD